MSMALWTTWYSKACTLMHWIKQRRLTDPIDGRRLSGIGATNREKKRHFAISIADSNWNCSPYQPAWLINSFWMFLWAFALCVCFLCGQVSLGQDAWQIEAEWIHLNVLNHPKGTERLQVWAHAHETAGHSTVHCNRCLGTSAPVHPKHWLHLRGEALRINPRCGPGRRSDMMAMICLI